MLRVNPSLLEVAFFMTYPQMIEMFLIIFLRGKYGLYSVSYNHQESKIYCVLIHLYLMLRYS